ncbi:MAG: cyclic nucleotide-binding domain-containing protein [Planctomycetes bacterium]|nr:cyclic nucleotide-binding domain-containing protein [Planctomycetota bacterium]MCB9888061.1 cyclic nucleotide-binding domain-containing protein [Planctomycetota bacterium]
MKSLFGHARKNLRVAWRTPVKLQVLPDLRVVHAVTRNVSENGVLAFSDAVLEVDTPVLVTCDLSDPRVSGTDVWPLQLRGVIRRSHIDGTIAITFERDVPEHVAALRRAVFAQTMLLMERISEFPAFRGLSQLDHMALTTVCHEVKLVSGEHLARLGDEATSVFLVKSGRVQLRLPRGGPGELEPEGGVETAHAGQVFGEVSALLDLPHNLDIVAQTDTELLAIPRESLLYLRDLNPNLALGLYEVFAAFMGRRLRTLTRRLTAPLSW